VVVKARVDARDDQPKLIAMDVEVFEPTEQADLCAEGPLPHEVGLLSKQAEAWVLITQATENGS
jgi:hypothetical protein